MIIIVRTAFEKGGKLIHLLTVTTINTKLISNHHLSFWPKNCEICSQTPLFH